MNETDIKRLKERLLVLKVSLQRQEENFKEASKPIELDQAKIGRLSRMDAMQAQEMALEASRRRKRQLLKADSALRRIKAGEYGYCFLCNEAIDIRRLDFDPTVAYCIQCAETLE